MFTIKKSITLCATLMLGLMFSFCSNTVDVYAGRYGENEKSEDHDNPEVIGSIVPIEGLKKSG